MTVLLYLLVFRFTCCCVCFLDKLHFFNELERSLVQQQVTQPPQGCLSHGTKVENVPVQAALRPARGLQQCLAEIYSGGAGRTEWAGQQSSVGYDTTDLLSSAPVPAKPMYEEYFPELFS